MKKSTLAKNFKKLRHFKSMNQEEFADLLGVSRASIGSYEESRAEPKLDVIIRLAELFKLQIDDIVKKELTVNDIAKFKMPEKESIALSKMQKELKEINERLATIESKIDKK